MKPYYLPVLVLMAWGVNAYAQKSNGQTVSLGVDKSKKPEKVHGTNFINRNLSNLKPSSTNASLLPSICNTSNLGSLDCSWKTLYLTGSIYLDGQRFISNKGEGGLNTFIGSSAGLGNTTGNANTAVGYEALLRNTEGYYNVAVGSFALTNNTTGSGNTANGSSALFNNTRGSGNTASGIYALLNNINGINNSAFGSATLYQNRGGHYNVAVGSNALQDNTNGHANTALGAFSMAFNTSGSYNTATGYYSLGNNKNVGSQNTANGYASLYLNTTGHLNTAIGTYAMLSNTTGALNSAFGGSALLENTTGEANTACGINSMEKNTTGGYNCAVGYYSLAGNTVGFFNVAFGSNSLFHNTEGSLNTALGNSSMVNNTTGSANAAVGHHALLNNTEGRENTAIGVRALSRNTVGAFNTALGVFSLDRHDRGIYNTAIGYLALVDILNGVNNTALGAGAGTSGNDFAFGTFLGSEANAHDDIANFTAIGFGSYVFESNQVVVGNTAVTSIGGYANWGNFSDGRYKNNVKENVPGLSFITQLRPVTYTLNMEGIDNGIKTAMPAVKNEASSTELKGLSLPTNIKREQTEEEIKAKEQKAKTVYTGFIAQEVEKLAKEINYDFSGVDAPENGSGFYSLRYGDFVVPLVKAVQELSKKNEELEERIQKLEALLQNNDELLLNNKTDKKSNETVYLSSARLEQNSPNPSKTSTIIRYYLPEGISNASVIVSDMKGKIIKTISLNTKGSGQININTALLTSGTYSYSLVIEGKKIDSRLMIVGK